MRSLFSPVIDLGFRTSLAASTATVWAHAQTMEGGNRELAPLLRMSVPRHARGSTIAEAPLGRVAFRSVLLTELAYVKTALREWSPEIPRE